MPGKLQVAWGQDTWVEDDDVDWTDVATAEWQIKNRGRQYELDRVQTGTAEATVKDRTGLYDFLNAGSPLAGNLVPRLRARILEHDPVANSDQTQFTGFIENYHHVFEKKMNMDTVTFDLVDIMSVIAQTEVIPSTVKSHTAGRSATTSGYAVYLRDHVDDRLRALAADAGVPASFCVFFTGNVDNPTSRYPAGSDILTAMYEAADGEFPGVNILYANRKGQLSFHGRKARFDPVAVAALAPGWDFKIFQAGDAPSIVFDGTWAWPSELEWDVDEEKIINACLCSQDGIKQWHLFDQLVTDGPSIDQYGTCTKTFEGLLTASGDPETLGGPVLTAREVTKKIAEYYVANYKDPKPRIETLKFVTPPNPTDARWAHHWKLMLECDISDLIVLTTQDVGGGGFSAEPFYIEGIRKTARPAGATYADMEVEFDVSPAAYYTDGSMFGY